MSHSWIYKLCAAGLFWAGLIILIDINAYMDFGPRYFGFAFRLPGFIWRTIVVVGVALGIHVLETRTERRFEWGLPALLGLLIPVCIQAIARVGTSTFGFLIVLLPLLVALQVVIFFIPASWAALYRRMTHSAYCPLFIFLVLLVFYSFTSFLITSAKGMETICDEIRYIYQAKSIVEHGTLNQLTVVPDIEFTKTSFHWHHISYSSRAGEAHSWHPIGLSLLLIPGYFLLGTLGAFCSLVLYSSLAGPILFGILTLYGTPRTRAATITFLFTLPFPFTAYAVRPFAEFITLVFYLLIFYLLQKEKRTTWMYAVIGFLLGYAVWLMTRRCIIPVIFLNSLALFHIFCNKNWKALAALWLPQIILIAGLIALNAYRFAGNNLGFIEANANIVSGGIGGGIGQQLQRFIFSNNFAAWRLSAVPFDKRFGVIWTNIFLVLLMPASLWAAWRHWKTALFPAAVFWSLHLFINVFSMGNWPAGACHEPRYILAVLPFLAIPFTILLNNRPAIARNGGLQVSILITVISMIALLCIPFRYDMVYMGFTQLSPWVHKLAAFLPWHFSPHFHRGAVDYWHMILICALFIFLSYACYSKRFEKISKTQFCLLLLAAIAIIDVYQYIRGPLG